MKYLTSTSKKFSSISSREGRRLLSDTCFTLISGGSRNNAPDDRCTQSRTINLSSSRRRESKIISLRLCRPSQIREDRLVADLLLQAVDRVSDRSFLAKPGNR